MKELSNVEVGRYVKINNIYAGGSLKERLLAIGLTRGTRIQVIRRGPWGDPTVYNVRGAMIALRKDEASLISVF